MNCQHDMCLCRVDAGQEVCSDHCRRMVAGHGGHDVCQCGHDACTVSGT
jgi:hypothetical protein